MSEALKQVTKMWAKMSTNKRISILLMVSLIVGVIAFFAVKDNTNYVPLFFDLDPKDSAMVVKRLEELGVKYQLQNNGNMILVPQGQLYRLRLEMAGDNLPLGGSVGFESFSQPKLGSTAFERNVQYLQALQGELVRTIESIYEVERARVHLNLPEPSLFVDTHERATASVLLMLRRGSSLSAHQIDGIIRLVSSAVKNLKPEDVTVVDGNGNILSLPSSESNQAVAQQQLKAKASVDDYLTERLQRLLSGVFGSDRVKVHVSVDLNFDSYSQVQETFVPEADGQGIVRSLQRDERIDLSGQDVGGVPGVTANIGDQITTYQEIVQGSHSSQEQFEIINYEISKRVEEFVRMPGYVAKISAAVVIDGTEDSISDEQIEQIRQLSLTTIGMNPDRGDELTIVRTPFDRDTRNVFQEEIELMQLEEKERIEQLKMVSLIGAVFFFVCSIVFGLLAIRSRKQRLSEVEAELKRNLEIKLASLRLKEKEDDDINWTFNEETKSVMDRIEKLVNDDPKVVAKLLEAWVKS